MMADEIIKMMETGSSQAEVGRSLGFSETTLNRWALEYPEIKEATEIGKSKSKGWWEEQGHENLKNKDFNFVGWYMQMKNRHGYTDRKAIYPTREIPGFKKMTIIEQMKEIDGLMQDGKCSADEYQTLLSAIKIKMEILFDSEMAEQHIEMYEEFILKNKNPIQ